MTSFDITGMSCAACAARIEKAVRKLPGITACTVSLLTNSMTVDGSAPHDDVILSVRRAGYGATLSSNTASAKLLEARTAQPDKIASTLIRRLCVSVPFLLLLMAFSMGSTMFGARCLLANPIATALAELLLAAAVMVINQQFFISGVTAILHKSPNMDTLVSLGAATAFGWSTVTLFGMTTAEFASAAAATQALSRLTYEAPAMILVLITVGKLLESMAKGKTTSALAALLKLKPTRINILRGDSETTVSPDDVHVGDVFLVRPGENIPVDGTILEGTGAVNESALTGESLPVDKAPGDALSAGTLNQTGFFKCRALQVGEDTSLARLIRLVLDASVTKAPIARLADQVAGVFVPAVIAIACVTLAVWLLLGADTYIALSHGIAVLVISCPCALGLATPVAIMVGCGVAARHGILFRTASALETTGRVSIVALDKTGTLTSGHPAVTDVLPAPGTERGDLLAVACCLESKSSHPIARAVTKYAIECTAVTDCTDFMEIPGKGLTALQDGHALKCGNRAFCLPQATAPDQAAVWADDLTRQGKTPLFFMRDNTLLGIIAVADTLRPEAQKTIAELKALQLDVVMLTGDNARAAGAIASQAGITHVMADILPEGKDAAIRELQQQGKVAMVGDGINDAPALVRADIGMAIGAGTDIAIESADVILLKNDLLDIPSAIRLSRATLTIIRQNLFWAFFYNGLGIPLAAGCFHWLGWQLSPMFGAAAMSLSSVCVISNALRLNAFKIHRQGTDHAAETLQRTLRIRGMMCEHCEASVTTALQAIPEVLSAHASHREGKATVQLSRAIEDSVLRNAVQAQGYSVRSIK